jgi:hypothetical protein
VEGFDSAGKINALLVKHFVRDWVASEYLSLSHQLRTLTGWWWGWVGE